eukprot:1161803-Pelagomonas_calceolata.AAC.5
MHAALAEPGVSILRLCGQVERLWYLRMKKASANPWPFAAMQLFLGPADLSASIEVEDSKGSVLPAEFASAQLPRITAPTLLVATPQRALRETETHEVVLAVGGVMCPTVLMMKYTGPHITAYL